MPRLIALLALLVLLTVSVLVPASTHAQVEWCKACKLADEPTAILRITDGR